MYRRLVADALTAAMRQAIQDRLKTMQPEPETPEMFQFLVDRGKAEGKAEVLLRILEVRGVPLTAEQRAQILDTRDESRLDAWIELAVLARTADEVLG